MAGWNEIIEAASNHKNGSRGSFEMKLKSSGGLSYGKEYYFCNEKERGSRKAK